MKRKTMVFAGAALALAVAMASAYKIFASSKSTAPEIQSEILKRRDIASFVQSTGVIRAKIGAEVKVGSRISGRVERLYANIGDTVKKGQIIAKLEQQDLTAKVNETRMALQVAEANLELADKNYRRMQNLYAKDFVSRDKVDLAERDYKVNLAQLEQIKATLQYNETLKSYATIIAPISGVIASVTTQEGETVSATSLNVPTFVNIVDLKRLEVYAYVDETDIAKIRPGAEANITVDSLPDRTFKGSVSAIYPKATLQDNVVYYITTISIENPDGILKPDLTVNATIFLEQRKGVLAVPSKAIRRDAGVKVVYLFENGKAVAKPVKTGWKDARYTEIVEGLKEGERIVIGDPASLTVSK